MAASWSKWYESETGDDDFLNAALEKCKKINEQLNAQPWWDGDRQPGLVATKIVESAPIQLKKARLYEAAWVQSRIIKETYALIDVATQIKPIVDIFIPQSPEYSIPYACLWIIFKGISDRKEKIDSVHNLITSLSEDIPILEVYKDMFPTRNMKQAITEFYIHTLDLLWRLSMYYCNNFFIQLSDAMLPRTKYKFPMYIGNIKQVSIRMKTLCEVGHMTEQKDIKKTVDVLHYELRSMSQKMQKINIAQSHHYISNLLDCWNYDVDDVEDEFRKWQSLRFFTDMRDHWGCNGTLPRLAEWRKTCDNSHNSILWVSTDNNERQFWVTEFSVNLINICRTQGQLITFAMCDRPKGVRWTPNQVLKQLISQLLNSRPSLTISAPHIFNTRKFRKAETFDAILKLLHSIMAMVGSVVIVIDHLDKCVPDPAAPRVNVANALSLLVKMHPQSRIIVTTGQVVLPSILPGLPITFAIVNTKRRPRILAVKRQQHSRALYMRPMTREKFRKFYG
ncbi:hypothetical protein A0O28_0067080 [Trichoderma guizhouense]|uniref:Uncharacterized protein n=1 Tax=Trichoderma guizhouense TaxID=1491466 RepID=A0A1T3CZT5_9HYPO|nr:hypothetical protein A0O28_0067080 [Trichoderma guizhouense]